MARRLIAIVAGFALVLALSLGVVAGLFGSAQTAALAQGPTPTATATATPGSHGTTHPLPAQLEFLRGMTPDQRFDHTLSAQATFVNPQGQHVVLNATPGRVASVGTNAVTITPNGATQARTVNVTANTWLVTRPHQGTLTSFKAGDRVVVFTIGSSDNAVAIVAARMSHTAAAAMTGGS